MTSAPSTPKATPDEPQWSIDEFAQRANDALADKSPDLASSKPDSRLASKMTPRNLRRLVSQGAIEPPARQGREAYFGPKHLEQVLATRELMSQGFTSSSIQALRNASAQEAPHPTAEAKAAEAQAFLGSAALAESAFLSAGAEPARGLFHCAPEPESFSCLAPAKPTTADALLFLSQVSPQTAAAPDARSRSFSGSVASPAPLNATTMAGAHALSGEAGLAKAYQTLGASKSSAMPGPASWVTSSFEAEPFAGLRLSARPRPGMAPLSAQQKAAALECIEQLWAAAMAAQPQEARLQPVSPSTTTSTTTTSTTPRKDQP